MLEVDIKSKFYRTAGGTPLPVLSDVAFNVRPGEFVCLTGPSGCGKSTTLRLILGLDADYQGTILLPPGRVAAVFQEPRLLPWRSVEDNVRLALPAGLADADLGALFTMLGIPATEKLYPGELSLGMARRVALARAFALEPALLLLDEPFVSLDDGLAERLRRLLIEVWSARPTTALMVTHNLREAAELSDRIILLSQRPGHIVGVTTIDVPRSQRNAAVVDDIVDGIRSSAGVD